jgi:AraC-like DNA-binding protein
MEHLSEERIERVYEHGKMTATRWRCDQDIVLGHALSVFTKQTSFEGSSTNDVVRLHYGLRGDYRFIYKQLGKTYDLIGSHHNLMYSQGFDITVENKTMEVETFGVQFPKSLFIQYTQDATEGLKRFAARVLEGENVILSEHWAAIDTGTQSVIHQIINCGYQGDLKKLFHLSKCLELLVLSAEAYRIASEENVFIKSKSDKEKIIAVRDLVNARVHCPPNLSEIAKIVGLNEYKLKRGFKETFQTTIFGYLTEQRLTLAHQLLRDTDKTAAEIAADLGYATPQHFNNAFKKKFGITPYFVRKNP